jgi:flagellar motility protein MotE (MotC chaperone)
MNRDHRARAGGFALRAGIASLAVFVAAAVRAEPPPPWTPPIATEAAVPAGAPPAASPPLYLNEPLTTGSVNAPEAENAAQYCLNIADAAADARYARQSAALVALQKDIEERIARMEAKRAEFAEWLEKRESFMRKADEGIVAIYSQMRPDAAASQMAVMEASSAAAILAKLNPRMASAILNEMNPAKAAQLTNVMAGSAEKPKSEGET